MDREEIRLVGPNIELEQPQEQPKQEEGPVTVAVPVAKNPPSFDKRLEIGVDVVQIFIDGRKEGITLVVDKNPDESMGKFTVLSASYVERTDDEVLLDNNPPQHRNYMTAPAVDVLGLMGQILTAKQKDPLSTPVVSLNNSKKDQVASILSSLPLAYFLTGWPQQLAININQNLSSVINNLIEKCKTKLGVEVDPRKLDETVDKIAKLDDALVERVADDFSRDICHPQLGRKLNVDLTLEEQKKIEKQEVIIEAEVAKANASAKGALDANKYANSGQYQFNPGNVTNSFNGEVYDLNSMGFASGVAYMYAFGGGAPSAQDNQIQNNSNSTAEDYLDSISKEEQEDIARGMGVSWADAKEQLRNAYLSGYTSQMQSEISSAIEEGKRIKELTEQEMQFVDDDNLSVQQNIGDQIATTTSLESNPAEEEVSVQVKNSPELDGIAVKPEINQNEYKEADPNIDLPTSEEVSVQVKNVPGSDSIAVKPEANLNEYGLGDPNIDLPTSEEVSVQVKNIPGSDGIAVKPEVNPIGYGLGDPNIDVQDSVGTLPKNDSYAPEQNVPLPNQSQTSSDIDSQNLQSSFDAAKDYFSIWNGLGQKSDETDLSEHIQRK